MAKASMVRWVAYGLRQAEIPWEVVTSELIGSRRPAYPYYPHAPRETCPACRRIQDDYPGGCLKLEGDFAREQEEQILGLARNVEERARNEHPLQRLMATGRQENGLLLTSTGAHLAHAIATALCHAYP
jgi:hypothetical protein